MTGARVTKAHRAKAREIRTQIVRLSVSPLPGADTIEQSDIIAQALADAEQAERERACAAIADHLDSRLSQSLADDLMAAIRARGQS